MIETISAITLATHDMARAVHFYEALGFETVHGGENALFTSFRANTPWLFIDIDRVQAKTMGVSMAEVFDTLQVYLASLYVNDFNRFGRTYEVVAQADASYRDKPEEITRLKTRNDRGQMVPLGAVVKVTETHGPDRAMRYNGYPAAEINGGPAAGYSSGQAEALIDKIATLQRPDGSFAGQRKWMEDNPVLVTAYTVMVLEGAKKDLAAKPAS